MRPGPSTAKEQQTWEVSTFEAVPGGRWGWDFLAGFATEAEALAFVAGNYNDIAGGPRSPEARYTADEVASWEYASGAARCEDPPVVDGAVVERRFSPDGRRVYRVALERVFVLATSDPSVVALVASAERDAAFEAAAAAAARGENAAGEPLPALRQQGVTAWRAGAAAAARSLAEAGRLDAGEALEAVAGTVRAAADSAAAAVAAGHERMGKHWPPPSGPSEGDKAATETLLGLRTLAAAATPQFHEEPSGWRRRRRWAAGLEA